MTDEQKDLCKAIAKWCEAAQPPVSHSAFANGARIDAGVWAKLRKGEYKSGTLGRFVERARQEWQRLKSVQESKVAAAGVLPAVLHPTATFDRVMDALKALEKQREADPGDEARGLRVLAEPGMGKTTMAKQLAREKGAILVDASPSWWTNYRAPLVSLCRALGLSTTGTNLQLELAIQEEVRTHKHILVFHQVRHQTVSARFIDFLLTGLMENTQAIVVLFAIPHFMRVLSEKAAKMLRRGSPELSLLLDQVDRRFDTVSAVAVSQADVERFVPGLAAEDQAAVAKAANEFGGLSLLKSVSKSVASGTQVAKAVALFVHRKRRAA